MKLATRLTLLAALLFALGVVGSTVATATAGHGCVTTSHGLTFDCDTGVLSWGSDVTISKANHLAVLYDRSTHPQTLVASADMPIGKGPGSVTLGPVPCAYQWDIHTKGSRFIAGHQGTNPDACHPTPTETTTTTTPTSTETTTWPTTTTTTQPPTTNTTSSAPTTTSSAPTTTAGLPTGSATTSPASTTPTTQQTTRPASPKPSPHSSTVTPATPSGSSPTGPTSPTGPYASPSTFSPAASGTTLPHTGTDGLVFWVGWVALVIGVVLLLIVRRTR